MGMARWMPEVGELPGGDGRWLASMLPAEATLCCSGVVWIVMGERAVYVSVSPAAVDHRVLHLGARLMGQRVGVVNGGQRRCIDSNGIQRTPVTSVFVCVCWSADWPGKVDTEEVTGSNPVSPTSYMCRSDGPPPDFR